MAGGLLLKTLEVLQLVSKFFNNGFTEEVCKGDASFAREGKDTYQEEETTSDLLEKRERTRRRRRGRAKSGKSN